MISKERVNEIKQSVNIVDVIGESVALTKAGRNYLGLCPFHGEKTPSFNVVEDKQFYHCFGCGRSGDVFSFIQELRGLTFADSVAVVAEMAGIPLETATAQAGPKRDNPHQALYDMHKEAARFYHALLMTTKMGEAARTYLHNRGLTDEVIKHFQIGLAANEPNLLYQSLSKKFSEQDLLNAGLFNTADNNLVYDAFQNRIMFPLTDEYGRVIAFSGRKWTPEDLENKQLAKYKNSRSTAIFNKSYELYHLDQAKATIKKSHEVYLMEGFMDVIAAHRAGADNAVASMGTALTPEHVQHLSKFCKKVILTYDGDKAGQSATAKALDVLKGFQVEIVSLPDNMDPDEFITKNSAESLQQVLTKSRMSDVEFLIRYLRPENLDNLQMQIEFVDKMAPIIATTASLTAQHTYIHKVAEILPDFTNEQVEQAVNDVRLAQRVRKEQEYQQPSLQSAPARQWSIPHNRVSGLIRAENHLFYRLLHEPYLLNEYRLRPDFHFETEEIQRLYEILLENGDVTAFDIGQESSAVQAAWYQIQEEELPSEMGEREIEDLEWQRTVELIKRDNREKARQIREQSHVGNVDAALEQLTQLIEQKKKME